MNFTTTLGVKRFAVRPIPDRKATPALKARIAAFTQETQAFWVGERFTTGWPVDPQYIDCWNWNARIMSIVKERYAEWLRIDDSGVRWSFFRSGRVVLDVLERKATLSDLLPDQIQSLHKLGIACDVSDKTEALSRNLQKESWDRQPSKWFRPDSQLNSAINRVNRPFWWSQQLDDLILEQVKANQWRWHPDHEAFTKQVKKQDIDRFRAEWEEEVASGVVCGTWYGAVSTYAYRRALELGAHKLVTTVPQMKTCAACDQEFHETSARFNYLGVDQVDICKPCIDRAVWQGEREDFSRTDTLEYLRGLAAIVGRPPESDFGKQSSILIGLDTPRRAALIQRLWRRPTLRLVNWQFNSWFNALKEAGVLDEGAQRTVMGTKCLAVDGHVCLSLAEKQIDDMLAALGIPHERKVVYGDRQFRADFMVGKP